MTDQDKPRICQVLGVERFESICEAVHNGWWEEKKRQGVTDHPDMIPYGELAESVKEYDRVTVRRVLDALGVRYESKPRFTEEDAKADADKPRPTLVPVSLINAVTAIREYGTAKYGDSENWRRVEPQRYRDALYRHWLAYLGGEQNDAESGYPHLWHLACNAAFLIEMESAANDRNRAMP